MSFTPYQLDLFTQEIIDLYLTLEDDLFSQIINRLKSTNINDRNITEWQLEKMSQLNLLTQDNIREIAKVTNTAIEKLDKTLIDTGYGGLEKLDNTMNAIPSKESFGLINPFPLKNNGAIMSIINKFQEVGRTQLNALNNTIPREVSEIYKNIINETVAKSLSGLKTNQQALVEAMEKWTDKGIPVIRYKNGARQYPETYLRMAIRDTVNQTYNELEDERASQHGSDLVLVSSHRGSRPSHFEFQGKVYSKSGSHQKYPPLSSTGYGTAAGLFGANCRHRKYIYIEGLTTNNQPIYDKDENDEIYSLTQEQRELERRVRAAKRKQTVAEGAGDEDSIKMAKARVRQEQKRVREFVKQNNLTRQYDREKVF